jgi:LysM repeat protein
MDKRTSATARIVATIVLVAAFVLAIVVISGALGGGDSNGSDGQGGNGKASRSEGSPERHVPATYVVKSGDTLIAIAHENGVSVARIEALNPEVDPQILIAGEKLKLR